jgi:dGTPase
VTTALNWAQLLTNKRLGRESDPPSTDVRSEFQRDADRIIYSSAFRRMQDKTQVFPLAESDYVRTRLTHSLEVAAVGRSLGTLAGAVAKRKEEGTFDIAPAEFGNVVAAACLGHDIGNPPFGHSGEDAIREWFVHRGASYLSDLTASDATDFRMFEGNAQGFRILTRLQHPERTGGMQVTCATLAAFTKYPRRSLLEGRKPSKNVSEKKFGFVGADAELFRSVAENVGLIPKCPGAWCRHPLAFLVEAADDICYRIIDLEDACRVGCVPFEDAESLLMLIVAGGAKGQIDFGYGEIDDDRSKLEYLRALAINNLIYAVIDAFEENYAAIMNGTFESELITLSKFATKIEEIEEAEAQYVYSAQQVVQIETAGFEVLSGLLDRFVPALFAGGKLKSHEKTLQLVPRQYRNEGSAYERLLAAADLVSGMTDSHALRLYRRMTGIELPGSR